MSAPPLNRAAGAFPEETVDSTPSTMTAEPTAIPAVYSTVTEERQALTHGAALVDRSGVGRLSYGGEDTLDLLQRLSTNDLLPLQEGDGAATVLTTHKGRIVDLLHVVRRTDDLLVLTSPDARQAVIEHIDFYTFAEDATVSDITDETVMYSVAGPKAASVVAGLTGADVSSIDRFGAMPAAFDGVEGLLVRSDFIGRPAYDIIARAEGAETLWQDLLARGEALKAAGAEASEAVRVERGVPAFGAELGEAYNPHEAGLLELVSFTKGCYVGQEVITRLDTYKKVQKRLAGLHWDDDVMPERGAKLSLEGKQAGIVTSPASSPAFEGGIGLGYVRTAQSEPGTALSMDLAGGDVDARVVELPFTP